MCCCVRVLLLTLAQAAVAMLPSEQHRHDQLTAMQAAFSRMNAGGIGGTIERQDLPNFLRYVVASMTSSSLSQGELIARSSVLTQQLVERLPPHTPHLYRR